MDATPTSTPGIDRAATAIRSGGLVVYPTETVLGLAADATDGAAVGRVFDAKGRSTDEPVSIALPDVETATDHVRLGDRERRFAERFLPGPVTLVCERRASVPDAVTAGRDRVGLRVPDHPVARALADRAGPVTATSANPSGEPAPGTPAAVAPSIADAAGVVLDNDGRAVGPDATGEARPGDPGPPSTVVDVGRGVVHRRGARGDAVAEWLAAN